MKFASKRCTIGRIDAPGVVGAVDMAGACAYDAQKQQSMDARQVKKRGVDLMGAPLEHEV
jgi:hypothetical protein